MIQPASFLCLLLALIANQAQAFQQQQQQQQIVQQPEPEPYSFSYSAESDGGMSTHSESGDGSGRVTGFYTIVGADGRERRVDYVADQNGYRASVKSNEVGLRNQNSADVQFQVQLPSAGQLEAAKISYEQYKFLEDAQEEERERFNSRARQHQGKVQLPFPVRPQVDFQQSQLIPQTQQGFQQPQIVQQTQQGFQQPQQGFLQPQIVTSTQQQPLVGFQGDLKPFRQSEQSSEYPQRPTGFESFLQPNGKTNQWQQSGKQNFSSSAQPAYEQLNQFQQPNSQQSTSFQSANFQSNKRPTILQQQLVQQFMEQANQLTSQDYPRQPIPVAAFQPTGSQQVVESATGSSAGGSNETSAGDQWLFNQQQSDIINDLSGVDEREAAQPLQLTLDGQQQERSSSVQNATIRLEATSTTSAAPIVESSTSSQLAPNGFLAINLNESSNNQQLNNQEQVQVLSRPQTELQVDLAVREQQSRLAQEQQNRLDQEQQIRLAQEQQTRLKQEQQSRLVQEPLARITERPSTSLPEFVETRKPNSVSDILDGITTSAQLDTSKQLVAAGRKPATSGSTQSQLLGLVMRAKQQPSTVTPIARQDSTTVQRIYSPTTVAPNAFAASISLDEANKPIAGFAPTIQVTTTSNAPSNLQPITTTQPTRIASKPAQAPYQQLNQQLARYQSVAANETRIGADQLQSMRRNQDAVRQFQQLKAGKGATKGGAINQKRAQFWQQQSDGLQQSTIGNSSLTNNKVWRQIQPSTIDYAVSLGYGTRIAS